MSRKNNHQQPGHLPDSILNILRANPDGLTPYQIARLLGGNRRDGHLIWKELNKLRKYGQVVRMKAMRFRLPNPQKRYTGIFERRTSGAGQINIENGLKVFISRACGRHLVDGDLIEVVLLDQRQQARMHGRVVRLLERRKDPIIGYCIRSSDGAILNPLDARQSKPLRIIGSPPDTAFDRLVEIQVINDPETAGQPVAAMLRVLGYRADFGIDTAILINKHKLRDAMPAEAEQEARRIAPGISEEDLNDRIDLRDTITLTIDPVTARDFDDAISVSRTGMGFRLGIHIADVSHYIPSGHAIDLEAYRRGTSVYFPERAIHMLPEYLATEICSLKPSEPRLTMTVWVDLDLEGRITGGDIQPSIIRSTQRLTYQQYYQVIQGNHPQEISPEVLDLCLNMAEACRLLIGQRKERGVLDLEIPESSFEFDENNTITAIKKKPRTLAEQTVEEFMIAANVIVARFLEEHCPVFIRRIHEPPDPSEIMELKESIARMGLIPPANPLDPEQVRVLLESISSDAIRSVASYHILRAMRRAVYSTRKSGHFGLALDDYTQFTSPIRRYPDLEVHRSVKTALKMPGYTNLPHHDIESRCKWLSDRERAAQEAEWDAVKLRKIKFMQDKIGQIFQGTITNVEEFGAFVQLGEPFVDGLIPVIRLKDHFCFNDKQKSLICRKNNIELRSGMDVNVRVAMADIDRGMLDFELV